jgi:hypothetical protein
MHKREKKIIFWSLFQNNGGGKGPAAKKSEGEKLGGAWTGSKSGPDTRLPTVGRLPATGSARLPSLCPTPTEIAKI